MTPTNLRTERARLAAVFGSDGEAMPAWAYPTFDEAAAREPIGAATRELEALEARLGSASLRAETAPFLEADTEGTALARALAGTAAADNDATLAGLLRRYRARLAELALEASLLAARGSAAFVALARRRFGPASTATEEAVGALTARWSALAPPDPEPTVPTDFGEGSLLHQLRIAVGVLRLPFRIVVRADLSALAATGDDVLYVATGRTTTHATAKRVALHEALGHALPRARAAHLWPGLFSIGTAGGVDEQEGYALVLEARSGLFDDARRRELAGRHLACLWMHDGATFVDTVRELRALAFPVATALTIAERAYRGGNGAGPGLGRERAYLSARHRVEGRLLHHPEVESLLAAGQVALED